MTGYKITLPKGTKIKDGKIIELAPLFRDASARIRAKNSKRVRVIRGKPRP